MKLFDVYQHISNIVKGGSFAKYGMRTGRNIWISTEVMPLSLSDMHTLTVAMISNQVAKLGFCSSSNHQQAQQRVAERWARFPVTEDYSLFLINLVEPWKRTKAALKWLRL